MTNKTDLKNMTIVTEGDDQLFDGIEGNWSDLHVLRNELSTATMTMVNEVAALATNPEVAKAMGANHKKFDDTVRIFFKDVEEFSKRIEELKASHENREGTVSSMDDFTEYNRVAFGYHTVSQELTTLIAPTMTQLVVMVSDAIRTPLATEEAGTTDGQ